MTRKSLDSFDLVSPLVRDMSQDKSCTSMTNDLRSHTYEGDVLSCFTWNTLTQARVTLIHHMSRLTVVRYLTRRFVFLFRRSRDDN